MKRRCPGFKPDDLHIMATDDTLTIRAERKTEKEEKAGALLRQERYEGEFFRTITVPRGLRPEAVTATYEHGVLTLHAPKAELIKPKTVKVEVKAGPAN